MMTNNCNTKITIPKGYIVLISGVPGSGKTTISYQLLKKIDEFRIIEETDLIREVLLGYNEFLLKEHKNECGFLEKINITDHNKLLSFDEASQQCLYMKSSIEKIIARQKRRGIPSIINGVHIVPSVLNGICNNKGVIFINLYVNNPNSIYERILQREPDSYMLNHISYIYNSGKKLYEDTKKLSKTSEPYLFNNLDITDLTVEETIEKVQNIIMKHLELSKD